MMNYHTSIEHAKKQLSSETENKSTLLMQQGTMQVQYFVPFAIDTQKPHTQDELYIISSGRSFFNRNGEIIDCKEGDVLFVPAGMEHRFFDFSEDFSTWVVFYGPEGGE